MFQKTSRDWRLSRFELVFLNAEYSLLYSFVNVRLRVFYTNIFMIYLILSTKLVSSAFYTKSKNYMSKLDHIELKTIRSLNATRGSKCLISKIMALKKKLSSERLLQIEVGKSHTLCSDFNFDSPYFHSHDFQN